ncbi:MAG: NAD(P)/FAD-dependent oxidoreductase [Ruminococcus sp.]|nr:NAD(P)/FAD-dependent oxidoreductase [Ruminococcus sp.]
MPLIVNMISSPLSASPEEITEKALKILGDRGGQVAEAHLYKTSLDARKQNDIHFVSSVMVRLCDPVKEEELCKGDPRFSYAADSSFKPEKGSEKLRGRIVIAGFGPAGMFCGLALAEQGYRPLIIERGEKVGNRVSRVMSFWSGGRLDTETNVQFGEGGAGTFSDGKLTTRIKDPLCRYVLERMAGFGAPEEILTKAKHHIGTDRLREVVSSLRERIIEMGGEVRTGTRLDDILTENGRVTGVICAGERIEAGAVVLAIGHSARDTFEMLHKKGIFMEPKAFSVGARIEHLQEWVDQSLYGRHKGNPLLPVGEYQLSHRDRSGRAVYTFCMCPGGTVVPAASEEGGIVTNGMSEYARDANNANSALVVSVSPEDFGREPLSGMYFARDLERRAYRLSGSYKACGTTVEGFLKGKPSLDGAIGPSYALGLCETDYDKLFPAFVTDMMRTGLKVFSNKMRCFGFGSAVLSGPETRTSSPVRISRDPERRCSVSCGDIYPCGEGAGYAGGIMSAAVDGLNTALSLMKRFAP